MNGSKLSGNEGQVYIKIAKSGQILFLTKKLQWKSKIFHTQTFIETGPVFCGPRYYFVLGKNLPDFAF